MLYFILVVLSVACLLLSRSNNRMSKELKLGSKEFKEDIALLANLKSQLNRGELIHISRFDNLIENIKENHRVEVKQLKNRLDDVIIRADEIAGARAQNLLDRWRLEEEKGIRADAIKRSQNVIKGKVTEHIVPHLPNFKWDPRDARFLGTPLDFVVFEGLSAGKVTNVIFVEVKTGKSAKLSTRERQCRDVILDGKVTYEKLHITT